jgi:hypothetical protein
MTHKTHHSVIAGRGRYHRHGGALRSTPEGISSLSIEDLTVLAEVFGFDSVADFADFAQYHQDRHDRRQMAPRLSNKGGRA